ncbi:Rho-type GTPase-activating protein 2-like [Oopsacas minuta]|uniref:Rho-type GTPase-activating protein 2-like n=1 Tax=Oopsacas minuta TaxID=111878 RepID=A0AAV7K081_9METZ|nr:Rho-type GTPase-activating protein 2-like [Oopsacas minuta]
MDNLKSIRNSIIGAIRGHLNVDSRRSKPDKNCNKLRTTGVNKIIGLNTVLVAECVAYLKKSISLREEGIFRIPGDLNQVKLYHKQFDYSMKPDLNEELDPNNISTLLKQHIKENCGLLPKREACDMYTAVRQKNIEEISSVIERIAPEQQFIMKEVLYLFKEVSEHEKENKMCTGAIATSCGLSIFPSVNAGNANLMLKILIDNVDEIYKQ